MKIPKTIQATTAALLLTTGLIFAKPPGSGQKGPGGEQDRGPRKPPPVVAALDTDRDGIISATEIAAASTALATLDKNGDGNLTRDELRPEGGDRAQGKPDKEE